MKKQRVIHQQVGADCLNCTADLAVSLSPLPCSIQALLSAPNPDDPLAENVAKHWRENEAEAVSVGEVFKAVYCLFSCCSCPSTVSYPKGSAS